MVDRETANTPSGRRRLSITLIVVGSLLLSLAAIVVVTNWTFLDTDRFAESVDEIRQQDVVTEAMGRELTDEILEQNPDLVAVRPVVETVASTVVGSDLLSPLVRIAAAEAQKAATTKDSEQVVLRIADLGAVLTSVLENLAPDLEVDVPDDLSLTLAEVGSQDIFEGTVALSRGLRLASLLLPVLALALVASGVWLSPNQRHGMVRAGLGTLSSGLLLGALLLITAVAVANLDEGTLPGAFADAAWDVWNQAYWLAAGVLVLIGALIAAAAAALLPGVDVDAVVRSVARRATRRPASTEGAAARGAVVAALGVGFLVAPLTLLSWLGVLLGLLVLAYGVSEITQAAMSAKAGEAVPAETATAGVSGSGGPERDRSKTVLAVVGVAVVGLVGIALATTLSVDSDDDVDPSTDAARKACNGHAALCDRGYDEVSYVTSHNAMSAADVPGWFLAEQPHGVIDQLDGGVRALMIDVWTGQPTERGVASLPTSVAEGRAQLDEAFGPEAVEAALRIAEQSSGPAVGEPALYMCHGLCEIGATELHSTLESVGEWLASNPDEVVSIIVENHVSAAEIGAAFIDAGLEPYLYSYQGGQWPTLAEMISSGQRLVVTTEEGAGSAEYPWLANAFDLTQDTPYTFPAPKDFSCEPNRGGPDAPLFLVNHWLANFSTLATDAERVNALDVLGERLTQCQQQREMLPNFVGVNYYNLGDVQAAVDNLNGVG